MQPSDPPASPTTLPAAPAQPADAPEAPERSAPSRGVRTRATSSLDPIRAKDWTFDHARHLLSRAGFGGSPAQINTLVKWGPEKSVDHLLNFESIPFDEVKPDQFDKDIMRPYTNEERGE